MTRAFQTITTASIILLRACDGPGDVPGADGRAGALAGPDVRLAATTESVYTAGAFNGEDWELFGTIRTVSFDAAGNLHIFDPQAERIVVLGPDGGFVRTVGGPGEGPGEFNAPLYMVVRRDGGYVITGFRGVQVFRQGGVYVRNVSVDQFKGVPVFGKALPDGRLVTSAIMRVRMPGGADSEEEEGEPARRPIHLFSVDTGEPKLLYNAWDLPEEDSEESELVSSATGERSFTYRMRPPRAFEPGLHYGVLRDGRVAVVDSIGYRVKLVALDGTVAGTLERPIKPVVVTAAIEHVERERRRAAREARNVSRSAVISGSSSASSRPTAVMSLNVEPGSVEHMTFANEIPVIDDMAVDWEGRIWVARNGTNGSDPGPTDIITADAGYVGTLPPDGLRIPDAFGPDGLMAYIESDELDVPIVRVIRLVALER